MSVTRSSDTDDRALPARRTLSAPVLCAAAFAGSLGFCLSAVAGSPSLNTSNGYNLPVGVTDLSRAIYGLHMEAFWICVAIAVVVFGAMIYSLVKFRRSQGADRRHHHAAQHEGGDHLDHRSGGHSGGHGHPGRRTHPQDGGHAQRRDSRSA